MNRLADGHHAGAGLAAADPGRHRGDRTVAVADLGDRERDIFGRRYAAAGGVAVQLVGAVGIDVAAAGHVVRVAPVRDLGVAVNVGVRLPRTVHLYPVPPAVVEIVPAYREYEYIQIDDNRIAIIDPDTFEVVDIIVLA